MKIRYNGAFMTKTDSDKNPQMPGAWNSVYQPRCHLTRCITQSNNMCSFWNIVTRHLSVFSIISYRKTKVFSVLFEFVMYMYINLEISFQKSSDINVSVTRRAWPTCVMAKVDTWRWRRVSEVVNTAITRTITPTSVPALPRPTQGDHGRLILSSCLPSQRYRHRTRLTSPARVIVLPSRQLAWQERLLIVKGTGNHEADVGISQLTVSHSILEPSCHIGLISRLSALRYNWFGR